MSATPATRALSPAMAAARSASGSNSRSTAARVRALTRQGERRWDVVLDRGQVIKLPEDEPRVALERVIAMQQTMDLLARDTPVVDVRSARMTVTVGNSAAEMLESTDDSEDEVVGQ